MSATYMVTTLDNPWNPFSHFRQWLDYDMRCSYNTIGWIDTLTKSSVDLSFEEQEQLIDAGVQSLLELDPYGIHVKVYEDEADVLIPIFNKAFKESYGNE